MQSHSYCMLFYIVTKDPVPPAGKVDRRRLRVVLPQAADQYVWVLDAVKVVSDGIDGAVLNANPYAAPFAVTAAGGYVLRKRNRAHEVVLIYRRGKWDLPKGKADAGESVEETAAREVQEELGINQLEIRTPLGATMHGYREKNRFAVKTTHWFAMTTEADSFEPQTDEDIEHAEWVVWEQAIRRLGYDTLRQHAERIRPDRVLGR